MEQLNVWILDRYGIAKEDGFFTTENHTIKVDMLSNPVSTFDLRGDFRVKPNDYLLVKGQGLSPIIYFGVVVDVSGNTVNTYNFYALADISFPATHVSGVSFEQHYLNLLNTYLLNDYYKQVSVLSVAKETDTPHRYQPQESPTITNLLKYLINAFKKYNIVWEYESFDSDIMAIRTKIRRNTTKYVIKNNTTDFSNWKVDLTTRTYSNKIVIYDASMRNSENPNILAAYYLDNENEIVDYPSANVQLPIMEESAVFDPSEIMANESLTTEQKQQQIQNELLAIATTELKGNVFNHEISFLLYKKSKLIDYHDLKIGDLFDIYYNDQTYKSVLTGYEMTADSNYIYLHLGHIRFGEIEL